MNINTAVERMHAESINNNILFNSVCVCENERERESNFAMCAGGDRKSVSAHLELRVLLCRSMVAGN